MPTLLALPTHALARLAGARGLRHRAASAEPVVHVYFHDTDLLDRRRRALAASSDGARARAAPASADRRAAAAMPPVAVGERERGRGSGTARVESAACRPRLAPAARGASRPAAADVRASRLYLLSRGTSLGLVRRGASIVALVVLDVVGLALGLYLALLLRQLVYGETPIFWSLLWREGPRSGCRFLAPITVLLFLQAGLYAPRERRPGPGRVLGSLVLVALVVLAFGLGTDYDFHTTRADPDRGRDVRARDRGAARGLRLCGARG